MRSFFRRVFPHTYRTLAQQARAYRSSLRVHALIGLGIIVVVATILVGVGIAAFVARTEQLSWQSRQREAARYAARSLNDFVDHVQSVLTTVGQLNVEYLQHDSNVLLTVLRQNSALLEVIRLDHKGQVLASAYQRDKPVLSNLFTISQSNWFLQARNGQPYAGEVQISSANEPYMILALPTEEDGVVAARLAMNDLWRLVETLRFGQTGQVYVIDANGYLIAHVDQDLTLHYTRLDQRPEIRTAQRAPDQVWTGEYRNFLGRPVLGSTQRIDPVNWMVVAETDREETGIAARRAMWVLAGVALAFSLLLILGVDASMRRILFRPIDNLRDGALRLGQGELDLRLPTDRHDELGQVANAFNEMAANLQQREEALAQARDAAQSASQFKSRLLANVSHDLRTPLSAILGFADILKEQVYGPLNERQTTATQRILANTHRLLEMVNSLLDQAQIEAGRLEWAIQPFAPADLLAEMANVMSVLAQQKGLQLLTEVAPGVPAIVKGDQRRVYQILTNLVGNAVKFTDRGWIRVSLRPDDRFWIIEVADSGRGIPDEALAYIFDPFHQVDNSTTRRESGVGLGLSIVQQLSVLMGGSVQVKSQLGQGSTFIVRLPVEQQTL